MKLMNRLKHQFSIHWKKVLELNDSPKSIAIGVAVGMFLGFTPLFGLKTLLAILIAWILKGNRVAAAVTVTLHDVLLPLFPVLLRLEYDLGYWILSNPHELPPHLHLHEHGPMTWLNWSTFLTIGSPLLIGSVIIATPIAFVTYFFVRWFLVRRRKKATP